jgi:hypothetical protein
MIRSPTEHLDFLLNLHVSTFEDMGIPDPNHIGSSAEDVSDSSENDPLLGQSRWSDSSSANESSDANCVGFVCELVHAYWNFQRWKYSSID